MSASFPLPAAVPRFARLLAAAVAAAAGVAVTSAAETDAQRFEVGLARSCFLNVNRNDALAAYRVFIRNMGRRYGHVLDAAPTVYDDTAAFSAAINRGTMHLAVMDAWQFLSMDTAPRLRPAFVPVIDGRIGRRYLVVARRDGPVRSVADLRGATVLLQESLDNDVCRAWLASQLPPDATSGPAGFFGRIELAPKPAGAVLPVFFGRRAAGIIDEQAFRLMRELNPQVGETVAPIAASEQLTDVVLCLGEGAWPTPGSRAETVAALAGLPDDPAGRQILALFRISGLAPFEEAQLATVRDLRARQAGATGRKGSR